MPLRKELLDLCQKIKDEHDSEKLQHLLDELGQLLEQERAAVDQQVELRKVGESQKAKSA